MLAAMHRSTAARPPRAPWQIHLMPSVNTTSMHVSWATVGSTVGSTTIAWGTSPKSLTNKAAAESYVYSTSMSTPIVLYDGVMFGLAANTRYYYTVGKLATVFNFTNQPVRDGGKIYAVLADLGYEDAVSMPQLEAEAKAGAFDAVVHAGDYGALVACDGAPAGASVAVRVARRLSLSLPLPLPMAPSSVSV
jgi:hypothetical protein